MNKQYIEKILEAAIRAPSGDNVQPWRFAVADDYTSVDLYNLPERDDSYYNYQQAAAYISHGAVIENMTIAARHMGLACSVALFPTEDDANHVARFDFQLAQETPDSLYEAIFTRSTNRFHYQRFQLSEESCQQLESSINDVDGVKGYFTHDPKLIKQLAKVLMINDRLVFERKDIHGFLFDKIRWNRKQMEETRDGMPVDTLGLSAIEKLFFPMLRYWWFVRLVNLFGLSRIIGLKCWYNCQNVSMIGFLTVKKTDSLGFIQAGRAMQRVWLEAARQGLAFQPIVGLPLLVFREDVGGLEGFKSCQRRMLDQAVRDLRVFFQIESVENVTVGFRLGRKTRVPKRTLRNQGGSDLLME